MHKEVLLKCVCLKLIEIRVFKQKAFWVDKMGGKKAIRNKSALILWPATSETNVFSLLTYIFLSWWNYLFVAKLLLCACRFIRVTFVKLQFAAKKHKINSVYFTAKMNNLHLSLPSAVFHTPDFTSLTGNMMQVTLTVWGWDGSRLSAFGCVS